MGQRSARAQAVGMGHILQSPAILFPSYFDPQGMIPLLLLSPRKAKLQTEKLYTVTSLSNSSTDLIFLDMGR